MLCFNIRKKVPLLLVGLAVFALLVICCPKPAQAAYTRLAGSDQFQTAIEISKAGWNESDYVVLVRGDDFADALCAGPLAKKYNAPILFTEKYHLNASTLEEIKRLKAENIMIIGGNSTISGNIEEALNDEGIDTVERIYGVDRYETSVKIAQRIGGKEIALATGNEYADALSISSVAAAKGFAILLTRPDQLPHVVYQHLNNYKNEKTYLIGGEEAISRNLEKQVRSPIRFEGTDRYDTNVLILTHFAKELDFNKIYAAPGEGKGNYIYALAVAALAGRSASPIVLNSSSLPQTTGDFLLGKMTVASKLIALGTENVVSVQVTEQYEQNLDRVLKSVFDQPGLYGPSTGATTIAGNLAVEDSDITIQNTIIEGDLLLGEGIGDGTVELNNVTVKGRTTIRCGWYTRIIGNDFSSGMVVIDANVNSDEDEEAELVLTGKSKVPIVRIYSNAYLDESDNEAEGFTNIDILAGEDITLTGKYTTINSSSSGVDLRLSEATVTTLHANASGDVGGNATITTANINANGVVLDIVPATTNVAKGCSAHVGGEIIDEGKYTAAQIAALLNDPIDNLRVATAGDEQVSFTFSRPTDATSVVLMQSTDRAKWTTASTGALSKNSSSATATGLTNDQKYYFKLVVSGGIRSGDSNIVSATPVDPAAPIVPGTPSP